MAGAGLALRGLSSDGDPGWQLDQFQTGHLKAPHTSFHCRFVGPLVLHGGCLIGCTVHNGPGAAWFVS